MRNLLILSIVLLALTSCAGGNPTFSQMRRAFDCLEYKEGMKADSLERIGSPSIPTDPSPGDSLKKNGKIYTNKSVIFLTEEKAASNGEAASEVVTGIEVCRERK